MTGEVSTETGKMSRKGGCPKGSTISNVSAAATVVVEANNFAAAEFHKLKQETQGKKRVKKGAYEAIMHETWAKYDLPKDVPLIKKTLLGHLRLNHKICIVH